MYTKRALKASVCNLNAGLDRGLSCVFARRLLLLLALMSLLLLPGRVECGCAKSGEVHRSEGHGINGTL